MRNASEVNDLTVTMNRQFSTLTALDHVSLTIGEGEVLGLVGESGAGKSLMGATIIDLLVPPLRRTGNALSAHEASLHRRRATADPRRRKRLPVPLPLSEAPVIYSLFKQSR